MTPPIDAIVCPQCGVPNDGTTNPNDETDTPSDGDLSVCFYCGFMGIFINNAHGVRAVTEEERAEAMRNPMVVGILDYVKRRT